MDIDPYLSLLVLSPSCELLTNDESDRYDRSTLHGGNSAVPGVGQLPLPPVASTSNIMNLVDISSTTTTPSLPESKLYEELDVGLRK